MSGRDTSRAALRGADAAALDYSFPAARLVAQELPANIKADCKASLPIRLSALIRHCSRAPENRRTHSPARAIGKDA